MRGGPEDDNRLPSFDQFKHYVEEDRKEKGQLAGRYEEREMALKRRPVLDTSEHMSRGRATCSSSTRRSPTSTCSAHMIGAGWSAGLSSTSSLTTTAG